MAFKEYRYKVELTYVHGTEEVYIPTESIKFVSIDSDYFGKKAFPIIYLAINLKLNIFNRMLANIQSDRVIFSLSRFAVSKDDENTIETRVIKDEFLYFFDNTNIAKFDMDVEENESYRQLRMGLLNLGILNICKSMTTEVVTGSMSNILYDRFKGGSRIIIEPLTNNTYFNKLIIPPIPTLNKLLKYLNNISSFYDTSYRFFIDLNKKIYLLSNSGNAVETKDNTYSSIIIKILPNDNIDSTYKDSGIDIDVKNKCYVLYAISANTQVSENLHKDKETSKVISIFLKCHFIHS